MNHPKHKGFGSLAKKPLLLIGLILAVLLFTVYEILAICGFVPPIRDPILLILICGGCGLVALILLYCIYSFHEKKS